MSIDIKNAIFRLFEKVPSLSTYLATMLVSLICNEVFPRIVYDELINEVNRKTDLDLDDMDIGVTAKDGHVGIQTCEFFLQLSPREILAPIAERGCGHNILHTGLSTCR